MKLTRQERQAIVASIPWVTRLRKSEPCTGFKSGTPLKAIFTMYGKPPVGLDNYRCKNPAWWRFRALKRSWSEDGVFCWSHLISRGIHGCMDEDARTDRWLRRNHPELYVETESATD